jgi:hypothetical protein
MNVVTSKRFSCLIVLAAGLCISAQAGANVVINELHINPDVKTELVEFVELYNAGTAEVSLAGWKFTAGIFFTFPAGATIAPGAYIIVGQDLNAFQAKWNASRGQIPANLIFGPYGGGLSNTGERVVLCDTSGAVVDEVDYQCGFPWPTVGDPVTESQPGTGFSMQLVNPVFDNDLGGNWRSALPTPAAANMVLAQNLPPCIRQVHHSPSQPKGGQVVTITAKVTDPDGVSSVILKYQLVNPGAYIARTDAQYRALWVPVDMHDDGLNGDVTADDDVYTVELPATLQTHRRLVRYQIAAADPLGHSVTVPYFDDPQPNFAYFVYDGVPAWRGAARPGDSGTLGTVVEYSPEVLTSLPVYHLIAKKQDVLDAFYMPGAQKGQYGGSEFRWSGTLVYDGVVYDHIGFRPRGGVWRFSMGKNMPKFDFQRGHFFQARDDYGRPYDTTWDRMNFSACIQQGDYQHRGEQGMFEAASCKLFNLMGCPASKTNWLHFRVIDDAREAGPTQYDGDFWGLYMTLEQMDGRFLDEHGLPDGNLYKMDTGAPDAGAGGGALNNQGPTQPSDHSDLVAFRNAYRARPQEPWWRQNVDLPAYYGFRCTVEGVHHGDMEGGKNWFFYHHPETNQWMILPWDLDLTWANNMYGSGADEFTRNGIFSNANLDIEYHNRLREFHDLLYNGDQMYQVLDDLADIIDPPTGGPTFVGADRAMWDYNPIMISGNVNPSKAGQGRFYQRAATKDFRGMVQIMKDYVVSGNRAFSTYTEDPQAPQTPVITADGPADFPVNALTFRTTPFSDPQGANTFAALKWRIAEVAPGSQAVVPANGGQGTVLLPAGSMWKYFKGQSEPSAPGAWRQLAFDDSAWLSGQSPLGYGEDFLPTKLNDMRGSYTSIYLRKSFDVADLNAFDKLILEVMYDDGVNVWINGQLAFSDNVAGENLPYNATASTSIENYEFVPRDLGDPRTLLVKGKNIIAVQVLNSSLSTSSDAFIDVRLTGEKSEDTGTTPGSAVTPRVVRREPGRYEIDAAWESDEIKAFRDDVTIPATAVKPGRTYRVRCRMKDTSGRWSHWSAPVQFVAGEPLAAGILADLRLTELMYHPAAAAGDSTDSDDYEFLELQNTGDESLDLGSVSFTKGITFDFAGGAVKTLGAGRFVLVVQNKQAFLSRYGSALAGIIAGEYQGKLANNGETVALVDTWNGTIAEFTYGDGRGWPLAADGGGHALVPLAAALRQEPQGSLNYPGNWRAGTYRGGSPGQDDPAPAASVVLNEFLANSSVAAGPSGGDWIELYNPTNASINLTGWYLSDDIGALKKWALPAVSIAARGYLSFDQITAFGLNQDGEQLVLSYLPGTAQDRIVDAVSFKAQQAGISLGRYPDGGAYWRRLTPSRGTANQSPILDVVVSELMYHPVEPNEEYVELYNPTTRPVSLGTADVIWRLDGAVRYDFPLDLSLPAGGRLVVVGFDPAVETSHLSALTSAYHSGPWAVGTQIVGPWTGNLSNAGERVAVEKSQPGTAPADPLVWVLVDEVIYGDVAPWPAGADGGGLALQRRSADAEHAGNDPTNWQAAPPTPGRP